MKRRAALLTLIGLPATAAAVAASQQSTAVPPGMSPGADVLSGDAIGFEVEHEGRDGIVKGRFVVKVDGQWKEIQLAPRLRIVR